MKYTSLLLVLALGLYSFDTPTPEVDEQGTASLSEQLGPSNFEAWAEFIRPSDSERKFEDIGWRNEFWPAVEEARALGRPLLLWTMNGHPLGCT